MMEKKKMNQQNPGQEKPVFKEGSFFAKLMKYIRESPKEEYEEALPKEKEELADGDC